MLGELFSLGKLLGEAFLSEMENSVDSGLLSEASDRTSDEIDDSDFENLSTDELKMLISAAEKFGAMSLNDILEELDDPECDLTLDDIVQLIRKKTQLQITVLQKDIEELGDLLKSF